MAKIRGAIRGLPWVDQSQEIVYASSRFTFSIAEGQQFNDNQLLAAMKQAGFPNFKMVRAGR